MKRLIILLAILALMFASCASYLPFTQRDEAEMRGLLREYEAEWGPWDVFQASRFTEEGAWISFIWLDDFARPVCVVFLSLAGKEWTVWRVIE